MNRIVTCSAALVLAVAATAQNKHVEISTGYNAGLPQGNIRQHTNVLHSLNIQGMYLFPRLRRLAAGIELNAGAYASFTKQQVFGFNGTSTLTDVNYNSNVTSGGAVVRYNVIDKDQYEVFGALRGGAASYNSRLTVENPNDPDGCSPLENRSLIDDYTWMAGARAGASVDMKAFIRHMKPNTFLIQAYAGYAAGGEVDYINVKNTMANDGSHQHNSAVDAEGESLKLKFVNVGTGETHDHEVARVYTSPVRYFEGGISFLFRF